VPQEIINVSILHPPLSGEHLKRAALALLEACRERLIRSARRALLRHLLDRGNGTIDDVRRVVDCPPEVSPKAFGVVPGALALAGIIRADGFVKTERVQGHARPVTVWKLVNANKAAAWLAAHPELPAVAEEGGA
jgi:hypothetical protein